MMLFNARGMMAHYYSTVFHKIRYGKVARGPRKKLLDFGGSTDHVMVRNRVELWFRLAGIDRYSATVGTVHRAFL